MQTNKGNLFAIVLITGGAFILLRKMDIDLDSWFRDLLPLILLALGYYGIKANNSFFGWVFIIIGAIWLISQWFWIIGILMGVAMIGFGVSMFGRSRGKGRLYE